MNEALKAELLELQNLESAGELTEVQTSRLDLLKLAEQAEQTAEKTKKDLESALAQKEHFRTKFEKEEADRKTLETKVNNSGETPKLGVEDFLDISNSLEGLDSAEKSYLAEQHKLTGHSLTDIRKGENFLLWQEGYKSKVEKERALKPNSNQGEGERPQSFMDKVRELNNSKNFKENLSKQEDLLQKAGLYKSPKPVFRSRLDK